MPQILVWQCPKTKKLFPSKDKYLAHLKILARERFRKRMSTHLLARMEDQLTEMRKLGTLEDIADWFVEHSDMLCERVLLRRMDYHPRYRMRSTPIKIDYIKFDSLRIGYYNMHGTPPGYGWRGYITISCRGITSCSPHVYDLFEKTGIALGGGGSEGAGVYKYGFTASAPDFYHMHLLHKLKDDVE